MKPAQISLSSIDLELPPGDLWVFAYGSLMWRPGFRYLQRHTARVHGYHRFLCVWSWVYRGTPQRPGLVLGLDRGGACRGLLYRVAEAEKETVADYLCKREMATPVYVPILCTAHGPHGKETALTFTIDRAHPQYAGKPDLATALDTVSGAHGISGPNPDYVINTLDHLDGIGIRDDYLADLVDMIRERRGR